LRIGGDEALFPCASEDTTKCQYQQDNNFSEWPAIESVSISGNSLVYTGTGFYTVGYTATAEYMNYRASSIVIDSDT